MDYIDNAEFKRLAKAQKSIRSPIRKIVNGIPQAVSDRQIKFVFSTDEVDRDFDVIKQDGIDLTWFTTNPLVYWGHSYDTLPIGKCVSVGIEDGRLCGVIEFAPADNPAVGPTAEGIYQLCKDGFLSAVSIGFIPGVVSYPSDEARYKHDGLDIESCELVEVSVVGIPSNRLALVQEIGTPNDTPPLGVIEQLPPKKLRAPRLMRVLQSID